MKPDITRRMPRGCRLMGRLCPRGSGSFIAPALSLGLRGWECRGDSPGNRATGRNEELIGWEGGLGAQQGERSPPPPRISFFAPTRGQWECPALLGLNVCVSRPADARPVLVCTISSRLRNSRGNG